MKFAKGVLHLIAAIIAQHNNNLIVNTQPYTNCDVETYYSSLSSTTTPAREDLHALIKDTHRNELPYTSSSLPDVWDAMIALDSDAEECADTTSWHRHTPHDRLSEALAAHLDHAASSRGRACS